MIAMAVMAEWRWWYECWWVLVVVVVVMGGEEIVQGGITWRLFCRRRCDPVPIAVVNWISPNKVRAARTPFPCLVSPETNATGRVPRVAACERQSGRSASRIQSNFLFIVARQCRILAIEHRRVTENERKKRRCSRGRKERYDGAFRVLGFEPCSKWFEYFIAGRIRVPEDPKYFSTGDGRRVVETPSRKVAVRRGDEIFSESKRDSQPRATRAENFVLLSRNERPARGSYVCRENLLVERSRASPKDSVARNRHCARCPRFIETILPLLFHPHLHFHPLLPWICSRKGERTGDREINEPRN